MNNIRKFERIIKKIIVYLFAIDDKRSVKDFLKENSN